MRISPFGSVMFGVMEQVYFFQSLLSMVIFSSLMMPLRELTSSTLILAGLLPASCSLA